MNDPRRRIRNISKINRKRPLGARSSTRAERIRFSKAILINPLGTLGNNAALKKSKDALNVLTSFITFRATGVERVFFFFFPVQRLDTFVRSNRNFYRPSLVRMNIVDGFPVELYETRSTGYPTRLDE